MHIKKFTDWTTVNESVDTAQRDKIFKEAEKWADSIGLKYRHNNGMFGEGFFMVFTPFGTWHLKLEAAVKKSGQDSMYRETYSRDHSNLKWYIEYPKPFSQYNARANVKPGNLKTFKLQVEKFQKVYEKFTFLRNFLETLGVEEEYKYRFHGNNLSDLGVSWSISTAGDIDFTVEDKKTGAFSYSARYKKDLTASYGWERDNFDPEKGEIFYYGALAARPLIEKAGKVNFDRILPILEVLKDKPVEEVWKLLEKGDWKFLEDKFKGRVTGKKYGLN